MKTESLSHHFSLTSDSTAKFNMTSLHWRQEMSHVSLIGLRDSGWSWVVERGASLVAQMVKNPPAMPETLLWFLGREDPLEKGEAAHSRILAWEISWTEEPGGLQSMGSQRIRHDWACVQSLQVSRQCPQQWPGTEGAPDSQLLL